MINVIWVKTNKKDPVKIGKMVYQIEVEQNCDNKIELQKEGINVFSKLNLCHSRWGEGRKPNVTCFSFSRNLRRTM